MDDWIEVKLFPQDPNNPKTIDECLMEEARRFHKKLLSRIQQDPSFLKFIKDNKND